ncbi:hypothetical protein YC2023_050124 [Brassica napus]
MYSSPDLNVLLTRFYGLRCPTYHRLLRLERELIKNESVIWLRRRFVNIPAYLKRD